MEKFQKSKKPEEIPNNELISKMTSPACKSALDTDELETTTESVFAAPQQSAVFEFQLFFNLLPYF
ncbi:MAG: hypothetical protein Q8L36_00805 [bacterium]|nr:hypothetical protein [bacterium]